MDNILFSKIIGSGEKHLLILHGLFGQLDNWNSLGKKFAEHYTVHLLDARNHGRSFHSEDISHKLMAEDLKNYMEFHSIDKTFALGHSLGGKAVMQFAITYPNLVEKLIVADMSPKNYTPHHQGIIKALKSVDFKTIQSRNEVDEVLKEYIKEKPVRQFLLKNVYRKKEGRYDFRFNLDSLSKNYNNLISNHLPHLQYTKPTLFLGGEKSNYITKSDEDTIYNYFPNATVNTISNAGHWLHAENPVEFIEKCLLFLTQKLLLPVNLILILLPYF